MGVSTSDLQKLDKNGSLKLFNENDLEIVKKTWNSIEDLEEFGVSIMIYIFQEHKEIKAKWIFASNLETEFEIRHNSQVKYHSKKVIDVFNLLLSNLNNVDDLKNEDIHTKVCFIIVLLVDAVLNNLYLKDFSTYFKKLFRLGESHYHYNVTQEHFPVNN
jgi:hypothetical protein